MATQSLFEYALVQGGFDSRSYIQVMDWVAERATVSLATTGRVTVVVQDNGSLHTSKLVRAECSKWQEKRLFIFFLPLDCSEINPIEGQWHQLNLQFFCFFPFGKAQIKMSAIAIIEIASGI